MIEDKRNIDSRPECGSWLQLVKPGLWVEEIPLSGDPPDEQVFHAVQRSFFGYASGSRKNFVMDKPLRFLVVGTAIAAGLVGFCAINNHINAARHKQKIASLENTVVALQAKCITESRERPKSGKEPWAGDPLVCDPEKLFEYSGLVGIQKEIRKTQNELFVERQYYPTELPYLIAIGIFVIAGAPWSWYCLLRRVRELSDAIRGQ